MLPRSEFGKYRRPNPGHKQPDPTVNVDEEVCDLKKAFGSANRARV